MMEGSLAVNLEDDATVDLRKFPFVIPKGMPKATRAFPLEGAPVLELLQAGARTFNVDLCNLRFGPNIANYDLVMQKTFALECPLAIF